MCVDFKFCSGFNGETVQRRQCGIKDMNRDKLKKKDVPPDWQSAAVRQMAQNKVRACRNCTDNELLPAKGKCSFSPS